MVEDVKSEVSSAAEVKQQVVGDLLGAVKSYDGDSINGWEMLAEAFKAWRTVEEHPQLGGRLEEEMEIRRQDLMGRPGFGERGGDPAKGLYNPNYWIGSVPSRFRGREEEFIKRRIISLSTLFEAL